MKRAILASAICLFLISSFSVAQNNIFDQPALRGMDDAGRVGAISVRTFSINLDGRTYKLTGGTQAYAVTGEPTSLLNIKPGMAVGVKLDVGNAVEMVKVLPGDVKLPSPEP